ncbi:MAG: tRNA threonylcarbamoyladenosine dehydratase [Bacilli bacterium]|nr:tRNA threonylcarbamoyladenosine dehydratase [Bacilli bacterium]
MSFTTRTEMVLGEEAIVKLSSARVAVFGLGGVGGAAMEALVRAGVGELHLIDPDTFNESNLNRQILSSVDTLGKKKTDVAKARALAINPIIHVYTYPIFFLPDHESELPFDQFDFVIDAIDTLSAKVAIALECKQRGIPMIACLGCGNRINPSALKVTDLFKTEGDPLAKAMRKACREKGIDRLPVVFSTEAPIPPLFKIESDSPTRRDVPGSTPFVPPVAGYLLAQYAVMRLIGFDPNARY